MKRAACLALLLAGCNVDPFCLSCGDGGGIDGGRMDAGIDAGGNVPLDGAPDAGPEDAGPPDGCLPAEACNDRDDDCDGFVDEGFALDENPEHCGACNALCAPPHAFGVCTDGECGLGDCDVGFYDLDGEADNGCEYRCSATPMADDAICDLSDDDCDGSVDEDVDFPNDAVNCGRCGRVCRAPHASGGCADGECALGTCDAGFYDLNGRIDDGCEYSCVPSGTAIEACNRADDDCDGMVDEGDPEGGVACGIDTGECAMGTTRCDTARGRVVCDGEVTPTTEVCNGLDDDCDGDEDEGNPEGGRVCGTSTGACDVGNMQCVGGSLVCVDEVTGGPETCNNLDDDCDGMTDEGNPGGGEACGPTEGACEAGVRTCVGGGLACVGGTGPTTETCNGQDDDCDGGVDEDNPGGGGVCGTDVGVCSPGTLSCTGGSLSCVGETLPGTETCNGQDDDCDGVVDDGNPGGGGSCGSDVGECTFGVEACRTGVIVCEGGTTAAVETCNTLDDDCDGFADDGFSFATDVSNCGSCGTVCDLPNAVEQCVGGSCGVAACLSGFRDLDPLAPGCEYECDFRGAEVCNGDDDDCDGTVDEGVATPPGYCNPNGVCAGTTATCGGAAGWVCTYPSTHEESETRCDGLDNDCDGLEDEPFVQLGTGCFNGIGACRRNGTFVCDTATEDRVVCNAPAAGTPASEACNGLDDDCDGLADEREADDPLTAWRDGVDLSAIATVPVDVGGGVIVRVMQYEASRPDASAASSGSITEVACSRPNVVPWTNVTWDQAQAACCALNESGTCPGAGASGWRLCEAPDWQRACEGPGGSCEWSYGSMCTMSQPTACNGAEHDCRSEPGDQDCLYTTGSPSFPMCFTEWGGADVYDLSGNVREWTATNRGGDIFEVRGGSYNHIEAGRACEFDFSVARRSDSLPNTGFRCCMY